MSLSQNVVKRTVFSLVVLATEGSPNEHQLQLPSPQTGGALDSRLPPDTRWLYLVELNGLVLF
ncbi:MAG TPA: hypothetical protein VH207_02735 [Chthoniobacterales bacterium]|jgi:hypothetical protein|nr:hypothetical protein [Chthoniobacterales bacterium]